VNDDVRTGAAVGFGAYLLWGLLTIYWKELHRFDPFELIGYRVAGSGGLLIAVLAARRRLRPMLTALRRPQLAWRVALAAVLLTANWTAYVWAVTHDNVVETALGYFLAPLGTMTLGVVVLGERMHAVQRIAAGLSLGAVAVLTAGYGRVPVLALVIAVSWTFYGLCKRRVPLGSMESLAAETLVLAVPAIALIAWGSGRDDGVPALATPGLRRPAGAVHGARSDAVHGAGHQLPARLARLPRGPQHDDGHRLRDGVAGARSVDGRHPATRTHRTQRR
jgi:chloramphenicol-sensitive protein RarD